MERIIFLKKHQKLKIAAMFFLVILISAEFLHLYNPAAAAPSVDSFYCNAEYTGQLNGHFMYRADVGELINFTYRVTDSLETYVIFGDGTFQISLTANFSHTYLCEGFYNVTLNALGSGEEDSDWIIIEIINDAPEFNIGFSSGDYYDATYTFETDSTGSKPTGWVDYNDFSNFYIRNDTPSDLVFVDGYTVSGSYLNLTAEDSLTWVVDNISSNLQIDFNISNGNGIIGGFTPGLYKLYYAADQWIKLLNVTDHVLYEGTSCYGVVIEVVDSDLSIVGVSDGAPIAIDWFKLVSVRKGIEVEHDIEAHGQLVKMEYENESYECGMENLFAQQQYGTIEFWYKTENNNVGGTFLLGDTFGLSQKEGSWFIGATNITSQVNITPSNDEWYHIRIDFRENNTIAYQGLSLQTFKVYINGNASNEFPMGTGGMGVDEFKIETNSSVYIDAVGYTWENYTIGDNLNPIISEYYTEQEITFYLTNLQESAIDTEGFNNYVYMGSNYTYNFTYIWDFGDGTTSREKSPTYKFINQGTYPIKLTLIDDQGAIKTVVRNIDILNRLPVATITWGKNYDTTYDFKDDLNGDPPDEWNTHGDIKVIDFKEGFSKVVEIDNREGGLGLMSVKTIGYFGNDIEFWIYFSDVNKDEFYFYAEDWETIIDDTVTEPWPHRPDGYNPTMAGFGFAQGGWKFYDMPSDSWTNISNLYVPGSNEWVHVRLNFDSLFLFGLYINGNTSATHLKSGLKPARIVIYTTSDSHIFLDSFGFTSDPAYERGDNKPDEILKYPGTWDFKNIPDGDVAFDDTLQLSALGPWIFTSNNFGEIADDCAARIIPELDGHYKILELYDDNPTDIIQASLLDFSDPTYGSIEFWLRTNYRSQGLMMAFGYEVFDSGIWLGSDGNWWYMNGGVKTMITGVPLLQNNMWHHLRIDFDCRDIGGYLGLNADQFYFWVDGIISNSGQAFNFDHDVSNFKWNIWSTEEAGTHHSIYLDAVGVTWDPAYTLGENLVPRQGVDAGTELLISGKYSEVSAYSDSLRFYWDFGDNQTAIGQTVLHTYQTPGRYRVHQTTIDSNGDYIEDEVYINVENRLPEVSLAYNYLGNTTYDFDTGVIGQCPIDWLGESTLVETLGGFRNVVEIEALSTTNFYHQLPESNQTSGTVELWLYTDDLQMTSIGISLEVLGLETYNNTPFYGWSDFSLNYLDTTTASTYDISVDFNISSPTFGLVYTNIPITFEDGYTLSEDQWTHLRVDFCTDGSGYLGLAEDTYKIYLDGHASQVLPLKNTTYFDTNYIWGIRLYGAYVATHGNWGFNGLGGNVYIDNVGFSWDSNYTVGENILSGLLMQFNEGETVMLEAFADDSPVDLTQLIYSWGPPTTNVDDLEDMGFLYSHNFVDEDDGDGLEGSSLISFVSDRHNAWDVYSLPFEINNVLPNLTIHSPRIGANLSVAIYRDALDGANFTVDILGDGLNETEYYFAWNNTFNWINHTLMFFELDLARDWEILVNQTYREGGQQEFYLIFTFENGQQIAQSFTFNGSVGEWTLNLWDLFINAANNLSRAPITFTATIADPSNDQIDLVMDYTIQSNYEIDYVGVPYTKYFTSLGTPDDVICELKVYEIIGVKYAQVSFIETIDNHWDADLRSGNFPVSYDINFDADMTDIDIDQVTAGIFAAEGITSLTPNPQRNQFINATYAEFNPSCQAQSLTIGFNVSTNFKFANLAPAIRIIAPFNITEDQEYTYQAAIDDFNNDSLTVDFYFGINDGIAGQTNYTGLDLGNNTYGLNFTYTNKGNYIITVIASDGITQSKAIQLISVENSPPFAELRITPNITKEGDPISFEVDIADSESDVNTSRVYWDFGDGYYSTERSPRHAYAHSGNYTIEFYIKDDNGLSFSVGENITIYDAAPEILGPFSLTVIEGDSFLFDVEVLEGPKDFLMNYTWDIYKANLIYNATYNFMNVSDGAIPGAPFEGFNVTPGINYQVVNNISGHVKVLELVDNTNVSRGEWRVTYGDNQSRNGTIEFWLRTTYLEQNTTNFYINLLESGVGVIPIVISDNGTWKYNNLYDGNITEITNLPMFTSKKWHHIRIDYECSNGSYSGLGENQWRLIVDGISSPDLPFQFGMAPMNESTYLDTLQISSTNATHISLYCDAIGYYDGTASYQIGDNIEPVYISQDYVETLYGEKPSRVFNEGTYLVNLTVENELTSNAVFTLEVVNIAPMVSVSPRTYYGDYAGYVDVTAYAWDSVVDSDVLEFEWFVDGTRTFIESGTLTSTISVFCNSSGITKGHVIVRDELDLSSSMEFLVRKFIDTNGDGLTVEQEYMWGLNASDPDPDGDNLRNFFELVAHPMGVSTDPFDNDTDDDWLVDGWENETQIGEWFIGTNPIDNDTDDDNLIDGLEYFGWSVSIYINNTEIINTYSSDPFVLDTDNDGVLDDVEYEYGTNPRDSDTDNDYLSDYKEIYVTGTDPRYYDKDEDGLWDGFELRIGTHTDKADTDGDGIQDSLEYFGYLGHKTDPLCQDTDHDFLSDSEEKVNIKEKIKGRMTVDSSVKLRFPDDFKKAAEASLGFTLAYGETATEISDFTVQITRPDANLRIFRKKYELNGTQRYISETIDIKDIIERNRLSYHGNYKLKVIYADTTHSDLCLEEYGLSVVRYLNPNDNDFDNDGIMDGVEKKLIVRRIDAFEYGDLPNLTADTDPTTDSSVPLTISDIGIVYDAEMNFSIVCGQPLVGNGSVYVEVIKKELDTRKEDSILLQESVPFSTNDNFNEDYYVDLSGLFPYNYDGEYEIYINIFDNVNNTDVFNLTNIKITADSYWDATSSDTDAWITRPDRWDTDGDGWSDKYEIVRPQPTNPLAWDTDGDGVKDSWDVDPLYDLVLEINLKEGKISSLGLWDATWRKKPYLQLTVSFSYKGEDVAIATPHTRARSSSKYYRVKLFGVTIAKHKYYRRATFNDKYTIDISDSIFSSKRFKFELWDEGTEPIDWWWDTKKMSSSLTYRPAGKTRDVPYSITRTSGGHEIKAELTLRGLERVNTIAIHANETVFNGHYNTRDRMHIYEITVNNVAGGPFEVGKNYMLIPNEIFIKTELNSIVRDKNTLGNHTILREGKFTSLDRDDLPREASNIIESFYQITCTLAEAMQILNMTLYGLINDTTGETAVINQYASTKEDNFRAEMMNLHPHVLGCISTLNPYVSGRQGSMPKDFGRWLADIFAAIGQFLVDVLTAVVNVIKAVVSAIISAIVFLITLLIKAILLILIWILFAITLLVTVITFALYIPVVAIMTAGTNMRCNFQFNTFTIYGEVPVSHGYEVSSTYNDFIGCDIPSLVKFTEFNTTRYETEQNFFSSTSLLPPPEFFESINKTLGDAYSGGIGGKSVKTDYVGTGWDFLQGMEDILGVVGTATGILGPSIAIADELTGVEKVATIIVGVAAGFGMLIALATIFTQRDLTLLYCAGTLVGSLIITGVLLLVASILGSKGVNPKGLFNKIFGSTGFSATTLIIDVVAAIFALYMIFDNLLGGEFQDPIALGLEAIHMAGFLGVGLGAIGFVTVDKPGTKDLAILFCVALSAMANIITILVCLVCLIRAFMGSTG